MKVDALHWKDQTPSITGTKKKKLSYTNIHQKEKESSISAACEQELRAGVLFLYKRKQGESLAYLSSKIIIFYLKVSPHNFTLSTILKSFKKQLWQRGWEEKLKTCEKSMSRFPLEQEMDYTGWKFPVVSSASPVIYFANWRERTMELWDWKLNRQHLNYDEIIAHH